MAYTVTSLLVNYLKRSTKDVRKIIHEENVFVNGTIATSTHPVSKDDLVEWGTLVVQSPPVYFYLAYHKPRGVECTLNPTIQNSLINAFPYTAPYFPVGRLDKESEGLLLLTNDGRAYNRLAPAHTYIEKEYEVEVDKPLTEEALQAMANGIEIMGQTTRPCKVLQQSERSFSIVLTQGLNRQIRRMCYKQSYEVFSLRRVRIHQIGLDDLTPGAFRLLDSSLFSASSSH